MLTRLKNVSQTAGLRLNVSKTKVMSTDDIDNVAIDSAQIEVVRNFNFLGSLVSDQGSSDSEIRRRLTLGRVAMNNLTCVWKDRGLSIQTKLKIVKALVFPVATYAAEKWTTTKTTRKKIQVFEMWSYRRLLRIP